MGTQDDEGFEFDTRAVRAGSMQSNFQEHSEALFLTSSFTYKSAAEAARKFANQEPGFLYTRFTNPTVTMFQQRLASLEGAEDCVAAATGMAAIAATVFGLLKQGDHMVSSRSVFGTVVPLFDQIAARLGITTTWVNGADTTAWQSAMRPNTKLLFCESPSNPLAEITDIRAVANIARQAGAVFAVDNCLLTPALQRPLELGADLVVHSATKYLDGQGRVLAGAVCGDKTLIESIYGYVRTAGAALSPFNAWICLKGLETLRLRIEEQSDRALELARWLGTRPLVERVYYAGLESHPQHQLAATQATKQGAVLAFEVEGGQQAAWRVIDACKMISITANLGDTKSTITHPATTTHARLTQRERDAAGISDGLVRVAVGLESAQDLQRDLAQSLR
ncbi:MAG: O-succinylhomoserine sulfhydrylase [Rhodocyclaceae bacterium]|nr:O-succinylhomoserine sulfhydrylase [Rhodocyclaceae bacterium]MCA3022648.1 O-succinylhomoserine sulfhydrylase [Rhodocyclaceae bacterium]MCA3052817.1 O-succinylhomoserine sulfhydrylase [Rhodocyclaceae bacterium]MCA3057494.1 O-succinylhomoserine sulfhydrylase [Rhodocyclaceae bacterium]